MIGAGATEAKETSRWLERDGVAHAAVGDAGAAMRAVKPPNAGMGRKPGAQNRTTAAMKDAILGALDRVGGESYLAEIARKDHKTFCALLGKLVPRDLTDEAEGPIVVQIRKLGDQPSP